MSRAVFGIVIGVLSLVIYIIASCIYFNAVVDSASERSHEGNSKGFLVTVFVLLMISCLIMTIVSGLLITGIIRKLYKLMAPWVYLSIVGIIISIIKLIINAVMSQAGTNILSSLIVIALQILIWYPIYTLYKEVKAKNLTDFPQDRVSANPSQTNYNQVPQNNI